MCWHDADLGHAKVEETHQQQNLPDDSTSEPAPTSGLGKNLITDDDLKASYALDTPVCNLSSSFVVNIMKIGASYYLFMLFVAFVTSFLQMSCTTGVHLFILTF